MKLIYAFLILVSLFAGGLVLLTLTDLGFEAVIKWLRGAGEHDTY